MSYEREPWPNKENDVIKLERSEARRVTLMYEVRLEKPFIENTINHASVEKTR